MAQPRKLGTAGITAGEWDSACWWWYGRDEGSGVIDVIDPSAETPNNATVAITKESGGCPSEGCDDHLTVILRAGTRAQVLLSSACVTANDMLASS